MAKKAKSKAQLIRDTARSGKPVDIPLKTSEKVLARITDGIYRKPASALRELISNAYDADATKVRIETDAPRFAEISVKDNGIGISPEALQHLIENIGGSAKRTETGKKLSITSQDIEYSPGGRKLIGKLGVGLFAVAQFTRHFLIITKCKGDKFRTVADVTLGVALQSHETIGADEIASGEARVWIEPSSHINSQGTEVKLLDLLPRTRAELCSLDRWSRIDFETEEDGKPQTNPPRYHIGRMDPNARGELKQQPSLPWESRDEADEKFRKFVHSVRGLAKTNGLVDLDAICDNYLQTIWELALACPLDYIEGHPFDLPKSRSTLFFKLENKVRGQAGKLDLSAKQTTRDKLELSTPLRPASDKFVLIIDGIQLSRPIIFTKQPKTANAIKTPLLFVGRCREEFKGKPVSMSRGPLQFEAYLFWTPKVLPKQHQGVLLRIGNAAGAPFDRTFMDYTVSEQTRLRQVTAEIFIQEGLDDAINLDRESYNFAHPHYQYLVKWLHSAIRQFANRQKAVGKNLREKMRKDEKEQTKESISKAVSEKLSEVGVEDLVQVEFMDETIHDSIETKRDDGVVAFEKHSVFTPNSEVNTLGLKATEVNQRKAEALTQLLYGWGLLDNLNYDDQARLVRDILEILLVDDPK